MGNLFLGFPVARAKIADMISTSAPPLAHKTQHQDGGSDEIDATGLVGAGGGGIFPLNLHIFSSLCESVDGYVTSVTGTGAINDAGDGLTLATNATADSTAKLEKTIYENEYIFKWDKSRQFEANVAFIASTSATCTMYLLHGFDETFNSIGFSVINGVLKGVVVDATTLTSVNLQTLGAGAFSVNRTLKAVFTTGVDCKFYVDGVLLGTITTGLPSGLYNNSTLLYAFCKNPGVAQNKRIILTSYNVIISLP